MGLLSLSDTLPCKVNVWAAASDALSRMMRNMMMDLKNLKLKEIKRKINKLEKEKGMVNILMMNKINIIK